MSARYEIRKSSDDQFYFNLVAANGEIVLTGERYAVKMSATAGIASVKKHSPDERNYVRKKDAAGKPMFVLRALNNEVIGTSESYASEYGRDDGITTCKTIGPISETVDLT